MAMMFQAEAAITTFKGGTTANNDFDSAITTFGGLSTNVLDFDSLAGGTTIAKGSQLKVQHLISTFRRPFKLA